MEGLTGPFAGLDVRWHWKDVIVVKPRFKPDPYAEASRIIEAPWHQPPFNAGTLVVDTATAYSETFLDMSADLGNYTNNPITFGAGKHRKIIPTEGDYRVAQSLIQEITNLSFDLPLDVCFVGHVGVEAKGKRGTPGFNILRAGMATVGSAKVSTYGGQFDQYIRLKYKSKQDQNTLVAQLQGDSTYAAKVREDGTKPPPPEVVVPNTIEDQRKFWLERAREAGLDLEHPEITGYYRVGLYGELGTGKTRLALSLPRTPIVYVAVDANSEFLRSMLAGMKVPREESATAA